MKRLTMATSDDPVSSIRRRMEGEGGCERSCQTLTTPIQRAEEDEREGPEAAEAAREDGGNQFALTAKSARLPDLNMTTLYNIVRGYGTSSGRPSTVILICQRERR